MRLPSVITCCAELATAASGFEGPVVQNEVPQIIIARSHYGWSKAGAGPVVEFAIVGVSSSAVEIEWASETYGDGMKQYAFLQDETYDYDFRDPAIDQDHVVGAGYAILGAGCTF